MPLTLTQIRSDLLAALDYKETGSAVKARQVVSLCRQARLLTPAATSHSSSSITWNIQELKDIQAEAEAFLKAQSGNGRVRHLGVRYDFRM